MGKSDDKSGAGSNGGILGRGVSRRNFLKYSSAAGVAGTAAAMMSGTAFAATPNSVSAENALSGSPESDWESWNDESIQGYTTQYSYLPGETVTFKIDTPSTNYRVRIFRLGWYAGKGARHLQDVTPSATLPQNQPDPKTEAATGLVDCGNWAPSASWTIPSDAVSGIYYALFERQDISNSSNYTHFVVRRTGPSDVLVQTSEMTQHAYNRYGGNSLYYGDPVGRAYKVSYNRPFLRDPDPANMFLSSEVALVRWLERNGYDVSYCGGIDVHQNAAVLNGRKVFISSGHDEYVSGEQRANVTAGRDAGVNMIFMSGNEYFWKVRFAPSIDGSNTADRTMVCYKETLDSAKTDPTPEWTGTWRDPRFSPPSNGGRPENELTGQFFRSILPSNEPDLEITVPAEYAKMRLWRNTAVATLTSGQVRTLAPNTLGYEFDCDVDNGFRPAGLIHLSSTTAQTPQLLIDYGATYIAGTCVHNLVMYRAASGALVFGTGTVQWSYGLDDYHITDPGTPTDPVMQQATINVLADMGAQPSTLQSGLTVATKSADTLPPTTAIVTPAEGAVFPIGTAITVAGTSVDAGGGTVAGIEASTDGGTTWHPATGKDSWSYVFTPLATGQVPITVRAIDDSCNIESPGAQRSFVGGPRSLPCSIWPTDFTPTVASSDDGGAIEAGVKFQSAVEGFITGVRFYKGAGNTGTHVGTLWTAAGEQLATGTFANESATGWQVVSISPVPVTAGTTYVASVFMPNGHYAADAGYFAQAFELPPLRALANGESGSNGVYRYGSTGFPTDTFGSTNYWVDVVLSDDNNEAPKVVDHSPATKIQSVVRTTAVTATFSEPMTEASIVVELRDATNALVAGSTTYDVATRTVTFTPTAQLGALALHTVTVTSGNDAAGNPMAAPYSWEFSTTGDPGTSPTSIWDTSAAPATISSNETSAVELGVRFTSDVDGTVTGLRYYKAPGTTGSHVGHLWSASGTLLATAPFSDETSSGWQQANLATPIAITKSTTYFVSYFSPNGVYGLSSGYFTSSAADRGAIHAPQSVTGALNGVYRYGPSGFPSDSYGNANYWADVVFVMAADNTAPQVVNVEPAADILAVATTQAIRVTFSEPIDSGSLTFSLKTASGATVASSVAYDGGTSTATLTPNSALAQNVTYTASVSAKDLSGNAMAAPMTWKFTTATVAGATPATLWDTSSIPASAASSDGLAIEVGVRIVPQSDGQITGIRFYKGSGNTGSHVGHLWAADGALLGTATFSNESAVGWQQALFGAPIQVTAGVPLVASYFAPNGHYAADAGGLSAAVTRAPLQAPASTGSAPNGLYKYGAGGFPNSSYNATNYWVDAIFVDTAAPTVTSVTPVSGETGVALTATMSATFSEPVIPSSISIKLRDSGGGVVAGASAYDSGSNTVTFTPTSPLSGSASFTASVEAATDLQGNPIASPTTWSFQTIGATVVSIWPNNVVPATLLVNDTGPLEVGTKFRASSAGAVQGVRFYKGGPANSGSHVGNLWAADGTLLASVTFGAETARGWQSAMFTTPVSLTPGNTYVVSYFAPKGMYSADGGYFASRNVVSGPLEALQTGTDGGNGVYKYGSASAFPTDTYNGGNYWVDVLFVAG
ncbi:secreted protein [Antricoccus suffuscus]|uniref:Secreted protein n=1 Tax=Antricoccus suffuscus TaxID=1629062 RepID=A0A2T1A1J3_9ACTN|nr:DUF4082 domain-containing protein [Antricoccus suffuscus]PRZ42480.1 secreted protein [Antricoccus suffuscus]